MITTRTSAEEGAEIVDKAKFVAIPGIITAGAVSGIAQGVYSVVEGVGTLVLHPIKTADNIGYAVVNYDKTATAIYEGLKGRVSAVVYVDTDDFISVYNASVAVGQTVFDVCTVVCSVGAGVAVKGTQVTKVAVDVSATADKAAEVAKLAQTLKKVAEAKAAAKAAKLEFSNHAVQRLIERGVSVEQASQVIGKSQPFKYFHDNLVKIGYYDKASGIFIATDGVTNEIITVITDVSEQYITNLQKIVQ